ncbi:GGDEF domain-containing protein [Marinobacterium jannaschii]|uniref:GGDEF domain-containing protein n=1 Tax=Marinobacterium jannaschii TaxID=64970 RepID=UPI000683EF5E|nr:GGDEF domain-containing protein [Marinobacterium jannaschii]
MEQHPKKNRYSRRIVVYAISVSCVILLFILGQLLHLKHLHSSWRQFGSEAHARSIILADLNRAIGYGGLIHNFKNYLLRREDKLLPLLQQNHDDFLHAMQRYRQLPLQSRERRALDQVQAVISAYSRHVEIIQRSDLPLPRLDLLDQLVRIDDQPALRALQQLQDHNSRFVRHHQVLLDRQIRNSLLFLLSGLILMPVVLWAAWRYNGLISHLLQARLENNRVRQALNDSHRQEEALKQMAFQCPLTGVANRAAFERHFDAAVESAIARDKHIALLFIDLDDFKLINDRFGHDIGDKVLVAVAERLSSVLREGDQVARIGGDEFAMLALDIDNSEQFNALAMRLYQAVGEPFACLPEEVDISCSVGGALFPEQGRSLEALLKVADANMYRIKRSGKRGMMITV